MNHKKMTQKAILQSNTKVATHISGEKKIKCTDTSNGKLQQTLLSNPTLSIITMTIDPWFPDIVATCGGTTHAITMPTTKGVITDAASSSARSPWNPRHVSRMGRDGNTPCSGDIVLSTPRDNGPVLIRGIVFPPKMGNIQSQDIIKKRRSISPSIGC